MSTVLQGDTSPHDKIVVNGNTSGTANLVFTKVSGYGSQTIEGIKVVQVAGTSDGRLHEAGLESPHGPVPISTI